jgi:hypothetical protein
MRRSSNLAEDTEERAFTIFKLSREELPEPEKRSAISEYLAKIGRKGGLKGGPARANKLSKKKLRDIGKKAADVRWGKKRAPKRQKT